jgi:hypothetical protein
MEYSLRGMCAQEKERSRAQEMRAGWNRAVSNRPRDRASAHMTFVDSALLNLTESFCRRFQVLTGRTNLWLAGQLTNLSVVIYFVWVGLHFWRGGIAERLVVGVFCTALLYVLSQTVLKVPIETYESSAYQRLAQGLRNPRRIRDSVLRISFLTLCVFLSYPIVLAYTVLRLHIVLLTYLLVVLTTVVLYLLACDPLPPARARVKAWLRKPAAAQVPSE